MITPITLYCSYLCLHLPDRRLHEANEVTALFISLTSLPYIVPVIIRSTIKIYEMNDLFFYLSIAIVLDHMLSTEDRENNESESMPLRPFKAG